MRAFLPAVIICCLFMVSCASRRQIGVAGEYERVITHKVDDRDTWESIAGEYYGDEGAGVELAVYNGGDPGEDPSPGSGVKIPFTGRELRRFNRRLSAAREYNRGLELASKGNYSDAVKKFQEAIKAAPPFADAAFNLGVAYQKLGLYGNSAIVLSDLVIKERTNPDYFYALGVSYFHQRDFAEAEKSFLAVLSLDRAHLKALFSLAVIYEKTERLEDAVRCWNRYLDNAGDGEWAREARIRLDKLQSNQ